LIGNHHLFDGRNASKYLKKGHNSVRKELIKKSSLHVQLHSMGDNPRFKDHPLETAGGVVFTRICYTCISKYLKMGHNSVRKRRIKKMQPHAQLRTMGDNPKRFQDHPLKTVVVFKRIYYMHKQIFEKGA